jgi:hypothetical protein
VRQASWDWGGPASQNWEGWSGEGGGRDRERRYWRADRGECWEGKRWSWDGVDELSSLLLALEVVGYA